MTAPFDPNAVSPGETVSTQGKIGILPDGKLDVYGLGDYATQQLFVGENEPDPNGYSTQRNAAFGHPEYNRTTPQYATANDVMQQYAAMSVSDPGAYSDFQQQMQLAGFYGSGSGARAGGWGTEDASALLSAIRGFIGVAQSGHGQPMTFAEYLKQRADAGLVEQQAELRARAEAAMSDRNELMVRGKNAAQDNLGRDLSDDEAGGFADQQRQAEYQAAMNGSAAPNADAGAISYSQGGQFEQEHQTHLQAGYMQAMLSALGPSVGGTA